MGMAVHDYIFYELGVEQGFDELTADEEEQLQFAITDFWEDLLDCQWDRLPCSEEEINNQIRIVAVAEKYQNYIAEQEGPSVAAYKYDGYYYSLIEEEHDVEINEKLWDRFVMGDITLYHGNVNFINGYNDEQSDE